jgi:hypothetical protein
MAKRKVTGLLITFAYLTLLALGSARTSYSKTVDLLLLGLHLIYLVSVSILLIGTWATSRDRHRPGQETLFRKWRRWTTDDYEVPSRSRSLSS